MHSDAALLHLGYTMTICKQETADAKELLQPLQLHFGQEIDPEAQAQYSWPAQRSSSNQTCVSQNSCVQEEHFQLLRHIAKISR